jgi:hypothetical protein
VFHIFSLHDKQFISSHAVWHRLNVDIWIDIGRIVLCIAPALQVPGVKNGGPTIVSYERASDRTGQSYETFNIMKCPVAGLPQ